jgi:hypothetical protein
MEPRPTYKALLPALGLVAFLLVAVIVSLQWRQRNVTSPSGAAITAFVPASPSATSAPSPMPTPTWPIYPTFTPAPPTLAVVLNAGDSIGCGAGDYHPVLFVTNTGGETLYWSASTDHPGQMNVNPSSGSVAPGASSPAITLVGAFSGGILTVRVTSNGGSQAVQVQC